MFILKVWINRLHPSMLFEKRNLRYLFTVNVEVHLVVLWYVKCDVHAIVHFSDRFCVLPGI